MISRALVFACFVLSGFCGLLYQVVWVRLAYASFGIITPVLSVVLSVFMLGLALGAWLGGRFITSPRRRLLSPVLWYALAEAWIGAGAIAVPELFARSEELLRPAGEMSSARYLLLSALALGGSILPFCIAMGLTTPFMMAFVRRREDAPRAAGSFSLLYLANVLGATAGALVTGFVLIELLGFRHTLWVAGAGNALVVAMAGLLALLAAVGDRRRRRDDDAAALGVEGAPPGMSRPVATAGRLAAPAAMLVLFLTGFCSMAMEVVWVRHFAHYLGTLTYSFASLLGTYLLATGLGSFTYRRHLARDAVVSVEALLVLATASALLPIVLNDHRVGPTWISILASITPLCGVLGYLTPRLIDDLAVGRPDVAGRAYALNVLGCILGPLAASYALLPLLGEKPALLALTAPLALMAALYLGPRLIGSTLGLGSAAVLAFLLYTAVGQNRTWMEMIRAFPGIAVRVERDYAGSVLASDSPLGKGLIVNGQTITSFGPITKMMAHLPMAAMERAPADSLVICFGMGTTWRSLLAWDRPSTAVELVPSVPRMFDMFFPDAASVLADPDGRIAIDDGRRFLLRSDHRYDVITIDPPPPLEAAGSSLLYSREFCQLVRSRLTDDGVLAHWVPGGEDLTQRAVAATLRDVFPHVVALTSIEGWGIHFLCSNRPLALDADAMVARMPEAARKDMVEWSQGRSASDLVRDALGRGIAIDELMPSDPRARITDDHPFNEYFLLRRELGQGLQEVLRVPGQQAAAALQR